MTADKPRLRRLVGTAAKVIAIVALVLIAAINWFAPGPGYWAWSTPHMRALERWLGEGWECSLAPTGAEFCSKERQRPENRPATIEPRSN